MRVVFVHCPKTAGCSVSRAIGGCHAAIRKPLVRDNHFSVLRYEGDLADSFVFTVARNPWDRMVSCYRYASARSDPNPKAYWLQQRGSFRDFVMYIQGIDEEFGLGGEKAFRDDPTRLRKSLERCHLRNIVDCVSIRGAVRANLVCNFHRLAEDWRFLSRVLGVAPTLEVVNACPHPADYREFYDDRLAEIVGKMYSKDIEYFGYSFEDPTQFSLGSSPRIAKPQ